MATKGIHHATLAAAAKQGFTMTADEDAITVTSKKPKFEFTVVATGKQALEDAVAYATILTEWSRIEVECNDDSESAWTLTLDAGEEADAIVIEGERLAKVLDAMLDAATEAGVDPASEPAKGGVVVPEKYKAEYKARGDASGCGDWVFQQLKGRYEVTTEAGKRFDEERYTAMLALNGVALTGKWASLPQSGQKGWEGRYRMNGGQLLRVRVAATGVLHIDEQTTLTCPQEDLEILWRKHPDAYTTYDEAKQPPKTDEKGKSRKAKQEEPA